MNEIINRLKELLAKATPGRWVTDDGECGTWGVFADNDSDAICYLVDPTRPGFRPLREEDEANATLIVTAINALPALLSTLTNLTPSGVERLRAEAFEEAATWHDREATKHAALQATAELAGGKGRMIASHEGLRRAHESYAKELRALALPSEPPSQVTRYPVDGGLGEQKQPLDEAFSGFDMLRDRFAPSVEPPLQGDVEGRAGEQIAENAIRITLAPDGGLRLLLPSGRGLDVGTGASAMHYIQRILVDATAGMREQRGYIGEFPTQHVIDIWRKQDEAGRLEAQRTEFKERGIDLEALDFQL